MAAYVAYFRVSTATQGRSGLGLAAQRSKIAEFLGADDAVIAEFVEVQSGKIDSRVELWKAIGHAKKHGAKLLIAKLDRFSRKVSFIASIMEQGIGLVVAEMPHATDFQLHIFAALAQEERRLISERTRAALAEAKKRGVRLGRHGAVLAVQHRQEADDHARSLEPIIRPLIEAGQSFSAIARLLNAIGTPTKRGGKFYPETVSAIVRRLGSMGGRVADPMPPLPDPDDSEAVFDFAMSFDGYKHHGSFEACADAAKARRRETLDDLRNELFFEARASRHRQDDDFVEVYRELLPLLRRAARAN